MAAAVIVVTNAVVLVEVARNRAGVRQTIQLTERELPQGLRKKEDSGVSVHLDFHRRFSLVAEDDSWLDRTKLEAIGFDYTAMLREPTHQPLPRPAYLALEYAGPAWEQWRKTSQKMNSSLLFPTHMPANEMYSRLFPVDAAKEPEPLLQKYSNRRKYVVVKGVVEASVIHGQEGRTQIVPSISEILPGSIHVPQPLSDALSSIPTVADAVSPRYTLTLSYGRNFEPWLVTGPGKN